jgi:hypothetical protein
MAVAGGCSCWASTHQIDCLDHSVCRTLIARHRCAGTLRMISMCKPRWLVPIAIASTFNDDEHQLRRIADQRYGRPHCRHT